LCRSHGRRHTTCAALTPVYLHREHPFAALKAAPQNKAPLKKRKAPKT
jgi:hypothetical protein